jgi:hypothetical protein
MLIMQQSSLQLPILKDLSEDPCVKRWLSKYSSVATRRDFAYCLYRFLKWLAEDKGAKLAPSELITQKAIELFEKHVHTDWLEEYVSFQRLLK